MKVIDVLEKLANGTLEDSFKFKILDFSENIYEYKKILNTIYNENMVTTLGEDSYLDAILNNEVEVIEHEKEIKEISIPCNLQLENEMLYEEYEKINELVRAVNKLNKEEK